MRAHINSALENTLHRLEPYFKLRETNGTTYARSLSAISALSALSATGLLAAGE